MHSLKSERGFLTLWVGLCFALTSAVYLSWLNRLAALSDGDIADWVSMVAGYLMQAFGTGLAMLLFRCRPEARRRPAFQGTVVLFSAVSVPALLADTVPLLAAFGLLMNLLCGMIAGFYLYGIALRGNEDRLSLIFGGGYAMATLAVGILALPGGGMLLRGRTALRVYLPLTVLILIFSASSRLFEAHRPDGAETEDGAAPPDSFRQTDVQTSRQLSGQRPAAENLALAFGVVLLLSLVKNLGFNFPTSDIQAGLIPELSRLPYALGLAAAGFINDRNRKDGMLCTVAALIIPFLMLGLTSEPLPSTVFWGMDYVFFAFFTVFRTVLFLDIARRCGRIELAPLGLLAGRLGDAAGSSLGLALSGARIWLILLTALMFFPAVFLFYRLYQRMYEPEAVREKSEQEVFETFCLHHDFSAREREVFRLLLSGRTNGEIAEALYITENTVKYHVRNLLQKTGCRNRTDLQRKYTSALYPDMDTEKIRFQETV